MQAAYADDGDPLICSGMAKSADKRRLVTSLCGGYGSASTIFSLGKRPMDADIRVFAGLNGAYSQG